MTTRVTQNRPTVSRPDCGESEKRHGPVNKVDLEGIGR
jgi:hypothetical protein